MHIFKLKMHPLWAFSAEIKASTHDVLLSGGWWFTNDGKKRSYYYSRYDCGNHNLFATKPKWPTMTNVTSVEMKIRPN